ncbi:YfhO family protein [Limosilactobacillus secaliphilus]|nr:YfhO family protein [Limosilactobacillus secaliphilus]
MLKRLRNRPPFLLFAFLMPVLIMGGYFAFRGMAPFGSSSILTVDLGQQYVDFFAYFRHSVLSHPSSLLYSFSKGLGGEMFGTNAYYLFSPLNFLLLPFSGASLTTGIVLLLLLKYGLASLSFAWLLQREKVQVKGRLVAFSTAYALMGWMIANQLNLLWLDALFLLPIVIAGVLQISRKQGFKLFIYSMALTIMDNYYMAWMIALFAFLFFIWQISRYSNPLKQQLKILGQFVLAGISAAMLAAWALLPTIYALLQSKGTYTETQLKFHFEYAPWKMLAKLVPGAFDFSQMPSGQPNIYVGALCLLGALLYFCCYHDRWQAKVSAGLISIFMIISFCWPPFDLLWHLGQYPVWYPSRFSFVWCFWVIWLAATTLTPEFQLKIRTAIAALALTIIFTVALLIVQQHVSYIQPAQVFMATGFSLVAICLLTISRRQSPRLIDCLFCFLIVVDVTTNAYVSLNQISYVSQAEYGNYTTALNQAIKKVKHKNRGFYRVGKNFMRTKDDPFQSDFYSADHFGSTMEPNISHFMGALGNPAGDGYVTYTNGTKVTDALLNFRYYLAARNNGYSGDNLVLPLTSTRPDWQHTKTVAQTKLVNIKENKEQLPVAFAANRDIINFRSLTLDPLAYQSQIFQTLAGRGNQPTFFQVQNFDHVDFNNVNDAHQITGTTFRRKNRKQRASVVLHFKPVDNDAYYLTLGPSVKSVAKISINDHPLHQYPTYRNTIVVNVADHAKNKNITVRLQLKKQTMWLQNVSLYKLNETSFNKCKRILQRSPLHVTSWHENRLSGWINVKHNQQLLMTTIPYNSGWHVKIDGQAVTGQKVLNTFLAVPITPGKHQVSFTFWPPLLTLGLTVSALTLAALIVADKKKILK